MSQQPAASQRMEHEPHTHAQLSAFNSAFAELGLRFRWDQATLHALASIEGEAARLAAYIEAHHAHLLKAYSIDFLCEAILGRKNAQAPGEWTPAQAAHHTAARQPSQEQEHRGWDWSEPGLPALAGA